MTVRIHLHEMIGLVWLGCTIERAATVWLGRPFDTYWLAYNVTGLGVLGLATFLMRYRERGIAP